MTINFDYPGEVLAVTEVTLDWDDMNARCFHQRPDRARSPGIHVSDIVRFLALKQGLLKIKPNPHPTDDMIDMMPLVVLLGDSFEENAARLYPKMHWQPGQYSRDGVSGNMDGISPLSVYVPHDMEDLRREVASTYYGRKVVDEFKLTYKSRRHRQDIRGERMWMWQVMDYIKILSSYPEALGMTKRGVDHPDAVYFAVMHVCWAVDDYVMPFRPRYFRYLMRFTQQEIDRNWVLHQKYKFQAANSISR